MSCLFQFSAPLNKILISCIDFQTLSRLKVVLKARFWKSVFLVLNWSGVVIWINALAFLSLLPTSACRKLFNRVLILLKLINTFQLQPRRKIRYRIIISEIRDFIVKTVTISLYVVTMADLRTTILLMFALFQFTFSVHFFSIK